jgi:starch-binding outer membrane protein, SusD/RagB family
MLLFKAILIIINKRHKMKRFIYLSVAILAISSVSCKKILQPETPSAFTEDYIFSNESDARKAVNGVYALFNGDPYTSRVSTNFAGNTDVEAGGVAASPDNNRRDIWSFEATPNNPDLITVWNTAYNAINRANECIEGIGASPIANTPAMKQLVGECKVLRAVWYKILIDHWGDVPFKVTPTKAGDEFYLPRTGRDTIMTFLIEDLIAAEPNMQWADQLDFGVERVNREFTIGMISRLSLFRGGYWLYPDMVMRRKSDYLEYYRIANTYAKKLVELKPHNLTNFATLFDNINKSSRMANEDVLYEVAFAPGASDVGWNIGVAVATGSHNFGSSSIAMLLTPTYYHSFDTTDLRLPVTCSIISYDANLVQQPVSVTSIAMGKWNRMLRVGNLGPSTSKGTGVNWPLMRYSDVLLMLAESENELNGPNSVAQDALKKVRDRAFAASQKSSKVERYVDSVSAAGKEGFFNAIVDERAWEFGGEFLRKYDLARWNLYGEKIAETINTLTQMGQDAIAGVGTYAHLPAYLYYRRNGSTIEFLNRYRKPDTEPVLDPVTGYTRVNWLRSLWNTTTNAPADYISRQYRGYNDPSGQAPVRYILPIHNSIITSSLGVLKNDGYGY